MLVPFTIVGADGSWLDVQAEIEGSGRLLDLLHSAGISARADDPVWVDDRLSFARDDADLAGLRPGSVLTLTAGTGVAGTRPPFEGLRADPAQWRHMAVVAGGGAGMCIALPQGPLVVGRGDDCDIRIDDSSVSSRHFKVELDFSGTVTVEDLGSTNGVLIDDVPITGPTRWPPGSSLVAGETVVELREAQPADAVVHATSFVSELRRPPRFDRAGTDASIEWPEAPTERPGPVVPLASAALPLVLGLVMFLVTGSALMLLFLLMTPMLVGANFFTTKRSGRKDAREKTRQYQEALEEAEAQLAAAQAAEAAARSAEHPDPACLMAQVSGPRRRLWERRAGDADFLEVRVGTARLPSRVRLAGSDPLAKQQPDAPLVDGVPCVVPLKEVGVLGVCGPDTLARGAAMAIVAQQAILSGPADLRIVVLAEPRTGDDPWAWARWLPHVYAAPVIRPGAGPDDLEARVRAVADLIQSRLRSRERSRAVPGSGADSSEWPWVLVVLDPAHDIRRLPGAEEILQRGPEVQVVAVCVERNETHLPPECRAAVAGERAAEARLTRSGYEPVEHVRLDRVGRWWCEIVARQLAIYRDPEIRTEAGHLPGSARLVDLLGLAGATPQQLAERWATSPATTAVVGVGPEGPFSLDLRSDGPHGLVAGTTGSGKSEFLQTIVASLAVANRPDAINFLFIDYKGGSAFSSCDRLPHRVGMVTDLDGHLVERALHSLNAELKRREELLLEAGSGNIDDYLVAQPFGPLPRLLIVIDEFAGLVTELPDFVTGLVGIAQRGRSLGIHLILATQRPSGVVSPEIRANTNLRVALRVVSPAESVDIIDAPDAARISPAHPGRAVALTGHNKLVTFQAARVGGPAQGPGTVSSVRVSPFTWSTVGRPPTRPAGEQTATQAVDPADTDLARLVDGLVAAAELAGVAAQRQPWLAPLPDVLTLDQLSTPAPAAAVEGAADPARPVAVGLLDRPAQQRQDPWCFDPVHARHLLVAGTPGSGRTTTLRTVAVALAGANEPSDVWIYVIDCGGGELRRLVDLPHCGAVVTRNEPDRADRLLTRLQLEMRRRLELLAQLGYNDLAEYRRDRDDLPYVVVMVDRWDGFQAAFDGIDTGRLTEALIDLVREGGSVGIRVIVTGDRQILLGKLAGQVEDRVCLNLADPSDYAMAGIDPKRVPPVMAPGRAVLSGSQAEMQIAVPGRTTAGAAQTAAVAELAAGWRDRAVRAPRPFRIDTLPDQISVADAERLGSNRIRRPHWALIGVGGDELTGIGVDLLESGGFVVAGPRRSGRSTALSVMAGSLLAGGCPVLALCPRPSPLRRLAGTAGVIKVVTGENPSVAETLEAINGVEGPLAVLIDDATLLHQSDLAELLEQIARDGSEQGHVVVVAGGVEELLRPMRGFISEVRQSRTGLLLCPESHLHGEVIGARLPRSAVFSRPPGRGVLISADRASVVQVPWPDRDADRDAPPA